MADIASKFRRALSAVGFQIKGSADEVDTTSPTLTSGAGAPTATEPVNSVYIRSDASTLATSLYRSSGEGTWLPSLPAYSLSAPQTGTGSPVETAHGLGVVPSITVAIITRGHNGAGAAGTNCPEIVSGTHTSTNGVFTAEAGAQYRVLAIR